MQAVDNTPEAMMISAIVAKAQNNVIGKENQLPWRLPADLKYFKQLTLHHHVLMGRKTFESIGKPLPERISIILTRNERFVKEPTTTPLVYTANTIEQGIEMARNNRETELFIIGGAEIYRLAMPYLHRLYVTEVQAEIVGDAFFEPNWAEWQEKSREKHQKDEKHQFDYDFVVYEKVNA